MAGNTRLVGFGPSKAEKSGVIYLERWGGKATTLISEESLTNLRQACYEVLPKQPQQGKRDDLPDFNVHYDESVGRVVVDMDPETTQYLAQVLGGDVEEGLLIKGDEVRAWVHSLKEAVQAHQDYHDVKGEPGVEDLT